MTQEARIHFQRALSYLEDIQRLSEHNVSPLIRQAIYNFQQADGLQKTERPTLESYPQMLFFWKSFTENLKQRLIERRDLDSVKFSLHDESLTLDQVETFSKLLPSFIDVLCCLTFQNEVHVDFSETEIKASGNILISSELENRRPEMYRLTRWFLQEGMILTFSHDKIIEHETMIHIKLRLPDQNNQLLLLDLEKSPTPLVGFSSSLSHYRVSTDFASRLGRHLCIEINEELTVDKYYRLPKRVLSSKSQAEIMHFAFLFRPVSFIIPRRSRLAEADDLVMLGGTGRGISTVQQEVEESNRRYFFIDILSLMSC